MDAIYPPIKQCIDIQCDIIYANLNSIKRKDFSKIKAHIGAIDKGLLKYFGNKLEWIQLPSHGLNGFDSKSLYKNPNICISRLQDVYAEPIAQYCIAAYFVFNTYSFRSKVNKSDRTGIIPKNVKVMIFGLGNIGMKLAKKCNNIGWSVIGVKRHITTNPIDGIESVYSYNDALEHLSEADYVVNILPESSETIGVYDMEFFSKMKHDAIFCNVGRKSAVVDKDISYAVKNRIIRGAILDAHNDYDYDTPDIILTGHSSSVSSENKHKLNEYYTSQLQAFLEGKEIKNRITLR